MLCNFGYASIPACTPVDVASFETDFGAQTYLIEFIMKSDALQAMSLWNDMQYSMLITKCQLKIAQRRSIKNHEAYLAAKIHEHILSHAEP